ncbi:MAG TPA: PspC domain-containing protein [Silvibacterium sp.]|nr:PspC domain-containing protein [Silvibacterium sp.]
MAVFCRNCGTSMSNEANFCSKCGAQVNFGPSAPLCSVQTRLIRPRTGRMIAGVCQGLANNYGWDVAWVRVITALLAVFGGGAGIVGYVIFWIIMPEEPLMLPPSTSYVPPAGQ